MLKNNAVMMAGVVCDGHRSNKALRNIYVKPSPASTFDSGTHADEPVDVVGSGPVTDFQDSDGEYDDVRDDEDSGHSLATEMCREFAGADYSCVHPVDKSLRLYFMADPHHLVRHQKIDMLLFIFVFIFCV